MRFVWHARRVGGCVSALLLLCGLSACRSASAPLGRPPGACQEARFSGQISTGKTRFGWRGGRLAWRQRLPPEGQESTARGPREVFTYLKDGTVLVPVHDLGDGDLRYTLRMQDEQVAHAWTLPASTVAQARSLYRTDAHGHITAIDAGGRPRLTWDTEPDGVWMQVTVACGGHTRRVRWLHGEGGAVSELQIDMGSGLADTRYVMTYTDGRRTSQRVLVRGAGRVEATPAMVLDCTPWLGAGRGVYDTPASPDVVTYQALGETRYVYDEAGRLVREETTHTRAQGTTITYAYDRGNLLRRDTSTEGGPRQSTRYTYRCRP